MIALFRFAWVRLNDRTEVLATKSPTSTEALVRKKDFHSLGGLFAAKFLKWLPFITSADNLPVVAL